MMCFTTCTHTLIGNYIAIVLAMPSIAVHILFQSTFFNHWGVVGMACA